MYRGNQTGLQRYRWIPNCDAAAFADGTRFAVRKLLHCTLSEDSRRSVLPSVEASAPRVHLLTAVLYEKRPPELVIG
jgi:hypothetical protein